MKRIFLVLFIVFPFILCAATQYPDGVIAVWEDSGTDIINSYVMTPVSTGGVWEHGTLTPAKGDEYYHTVLGGKWDLFPVAPQTAMQDTDWTIQWYAWYPTKGAYGSTSKCYFFSRGSGSGNGIFSQLIQTTSDWDPYGQNGWAWMGSQGQFFNIGAFSTTNYTNGTANAWNLMQICYLNSTGVYKTYINGTLTHTGDTGKTNCFDTTDDDATFRTSSQWGNDYSSYWAMGMDRIIFATFNAAGDEIEPLPDESPTVTPTPTFTITPTATPTQPIGDWILKTGNANWTPRVLPCSASYDNKLWVMNGCSNMYPADGRTFYNDVWYSADGETWTRTVEHAPWTARFRGASFVFDNKMWIAAGVDLNGTYQKDVWSSTNGIDWTAVTLNAAFGQRFTQTQQNVVYDGKMWIIGGQVQSFRGVDGCVNDVWYSSNGADWFEATGNAEFHAKSGGAVWVYDNKLWTAGGATCTSGETKPIWYSTDGVTWTATGGDIYANILVHFNIINLYDRLFLRIGGASGGNALDKTAFSIDGQTMIDSIAGFGVKNDSVAEILNGKIYLYAGSSSDGGADIAFNDVWYTPISGLNIPTIYDDDIKEPWEY